MLKWRHVQANVSRDVLDVAKEAALAAGAELIRRFGAPAGGLAPRRARPTSSRRPTAPPSGDRRRARAPPPRRRRARRGGHRRPRRDERPALGRRPAGRHRQLPARPPAVVRRASPARTPTGRVAGVVYDPPRDELFAAVARRPGDASTAAPSRARASAATSPPPSITGTVASRDRGRGPRATASSTSACTAASGQRRALGTAALELAWTAAGRIDLCYQEQRIHPWDVDAGLFICQRAGLRVHRLAAARGGPRAALPRRARPGSPPRCSSSSARARRRAAAPPARARRSAPSERHRGDAPPRRPLRAAATASATAHGLERRVDARGVDVEVRDRAHRAPVRARPCGRRARSQRRARARGASATPKTTMLVSTAAGSISTPSHRGEPLGQPRARCAWSSASRSTWWSSAYSAPAATMPAWRIAPPSICL